MNFYNHYLGDYARDTKELSLIEHGAYRILLDHIYATEKMLPDDMKALHRIAKAMTPAERKAVEKVATMFFPVNGDGRRHHKRVEEELAKAQQRAEDEAAKNENERERQQRHRERRKKLFEDLRALGITPSFDAKTEELQRLLNAGQPRYVTVNVTRDTTANQSHNQNQSTAKAKTSDAPASEARGAAASLPDCPQVLLVALYHEALPTLPRMLEWNAQRQASARSRWREKAVSEPYGSVDEGLAYWRRFFGYVAKSDFLMGRTTPRGDRKPFLADLEWLLKAGNFAKVIEGKYHS